MKSHSPHRLVLVSAIVCVLGTNAGVALLAREDRSARDTAAIERLHQQIVKATLSGKADELTKLWDNEGVRLTEGRPAEVGKAVIEADNKLSRAKNPEWRTIYYKPEIKDLQIAGDWAFEWGYFETAHKESAKAAQVALRGMTLRVLKRQTDGSWKLARLMLIESRE